MHDIVTPLFTVDELKEYDSDFEALEDAKIEKLERMVRYVVNNYCGCNFGYYKTTVPARSFDGRSLYVGMPVISVDSISIGGEAIPSLAFQITADREYVTATPDYSETSIIVPPASDYPDYGFAREVTYDVSGEFGYISIPQDLKDAAMTLAGDYGCHESQWRDRYVESLKMTDASIKFDSRVFSGTGTVSVDQILNKYAALPVVIL